MWTAANGEVGRSVGRTREEFRAVPFRRTFNRLIRVTFVIEQIWRLLSARPVFPPDCSRPSLLIADFCVVQWLLDSGRERPDPWR